MDGDERRGYDWVGLRLYGGIWLKPLFEKPG